MENREDQERIARVCNTSLADLKEIFARFHSHDGLLPEYNLILAQLGMAISWLRNEPNVDRFCTPVKVALETAFALGRKAGIEESAKRG